MQPNLSALVDIHHVQATMKKTIAMHEERDKKHKADDGQQGSAVPAYLLEREQVSQSVSRTMPAWRR